MFDDNTVDAGEAVDAVLDEYQKSGVQIAINNDQILYYEKHPASYFTWRVENHGFSVFGDRRAKASVSMLVRSRAKGRGLNWNKMKQAVLRRIREIFDELDRKFKPKR